MAVKTPGMACGETTAVILRCAQRAIAPLQPRRMEQSPDLSSFEARPAVLMHRTARTSG